ncbi:hypothetical protein C5167_043518 [Papaver somniferum]|uniref:Histone deacetylase interacting domain-containing protein n=1 Tax=Papaver somniferum TaxID=3469 RepID=A0A4Y7L8K4_PAPSO|nr:paired amphipathic helix protein Sin3-like 3 [Papaver somniferum]RZC80950.1 hypothetical protein C5167_043518 [Papaver somniferum]
MKMKRPREGDCLAYIKAVQKTPKYNEFLQVMKEFKSLPTYDTTNLEFVATRIKKIFRDHSNLILGFNILFLPIAEEEDGADQNRVLLKSTKRFLQAAESKKALPLHEEDDYYLKDYKFFEEISKEKSRNPDEYKKYVKCLYLYSIERISRAELQKIVRDLLKYGTPFFPSTKVHQEPQKDERETDCEAPASKRRKLEEPMIDRLLNCKIDNPSYQLSTETTLASGRTELGVAVLNDTLVSVESTPAGDAYHFEKNVYEKNLFKCEDDRCERDRQFELVKGTVERVEDLLQKIADNTINQESIRLEDHFKVLHLGCIKRLYNESWQDVIDALRKDAKSVLPGILTQLQKKLKEATSRLSVTCRKKMKAVYLKNFRKSLHYSNSSGEQQDTTSSSSEDDARAYFLSKSFS